MHFFTKSAQKFGQTNLQSFPCFARLLPTLPHAAISPLATIISCKVNPANKENFTKQKQLEDNRDFYNKNIYYHI